MRKEEQRLWDSMKRNAPGVFWLRRIENEVAEGDPDVWCVTRGPVECWVELKAPTAPKRPTTRLLGDQGLNPAQVNWHLRAAKLGVRAYTLIRDDRKRLLLVPSTESNVPRLNGMSYDELQAHSVASEWPGIFRELSRI